MMCADVSQPWRANPNQGRLGCTIVDLPATFSLRRRKPGCRFDRAQNRLFDCIETNKIVKGGAALFNVGQGLVEADNVGS